MAEVKKTAPSGQKATVQRRPADGKKVKPNGNALTAEAMEGMETAPLPESTPPPGQPGFHWGM